MPLTATLFSQYSVLIAVGPDQYIAITGIATRWLDSFPCKKKKINPQV